jgi:hypothetical protein
MRLQGVESLKVRVILNYGGEIMDNFAVAASASVIDRL